MERVPGPLHSVKELYMLALIRDCAALFNDTFAAAIELDFFRLLAGVLLFLLLFAFFRVLLAGLRRF